MLVLLSPAKSLDFESPVGVAEATQTRLLDDSEKLVGVMRKYSAKRISKLMSVSDELAELNVKRFREWERPFNKRNARQALFAFSGDVYQGIDAGNLTGEGFDFCAGIFADFERALWCVASAGFDAALSLGDGAEVSG